VTIPNEAIELLERVWLFEGLNRAVLLPLAASARTRKTKPRETVIEHGSPPSDLHVVLSGHFKVTVPTADRKSIILNVIGPAEIFGELSLLDEQPRSASVSAIDRGELLVIRRAEFFQLLTHSPETSFRLLRRLTTMVRKLSIRAEEHSTHTIGERLARSLLDLSDRCGTTVVGNEVAHIRLPQRELGELVQSTRESVNKWLSKWQDEGIVYTTRTQIVIRDRARLEAAAERSMSY
jgi:CRP/FNR family transcriptional regulator, cyclic AMP receptor protein